MRETDANLPLMAKTLGISEITARVMANRNIRTKNTALTFLKTSIDNLNNLRPFLAMKNALKALDRISTAIKNGEKITIYGDYDADGITSTTILHKVMTRLGGVSSYYIPHRIDEGYGMNINAIKNLAKTDTKLIIAVDNGIAAVDEIAFANALGIDTVVIDHHEPGEALPDAIAIVDPKQQDCPYSFKEMCAGGLAYRLADALCEYMNMPFTEQEEALVLAAIATICDIVPLTDENRILVNCGMVVLNSNKLVNQGLGSLLNIRGYLEKPIDTFAIGFAVGPCINAAGRLDSAIKAVELLLSDDIATRMQLAHQLAELNEERKNLTANCIQRILDNLSGELDKVLVITDTEIHESIAGIVAGRIRDITGHPAIVLTHGDGAMKGSGRSPKCYNLFEALNDNRHLLSRFGGHSMAAGLTIPPENVPLLHAALNRDCTLTEEDFSPIFEIDAELALNDITIKLSDEILRLAPFGRGNSEPLFVTYTLYAENVRTIDEKNTIIFTFADNFGRKIKGIAFGLNDTYNERVADAGVNKLGGFGIDVVYCIETNVFNGNVSAQMRVKDFIIKTLEIS